MKRHYISLFGGIFGTFWNFMLLFWHFVALFGFFGPFTLFCCKLGLSKFTHFLLVKYVWLKQCLCNFFCCLFTCLSDTFPRPSDAFPGQFYIFPNSLDTFLETSDTFPTPPDIFLPSYAFPRTFESYDNNID